MNVDLWVQFNLKTKKTISKTSAKKKTVKKASKKKEKYIDLFKINLNQSLLEEYIMTKNINKYLKLFLNKEKFRIKDLMLFCLAIIPGGNEIYKKFKKSW